MHILRTVLLVIALGASLFLGWRFYETVKSTRGVDGATTAEGNLQPTPDKLAAARRDVEKTLKQSPEFAGYFASLDKNYPSDYMRILAGFIGRAAKSGRAETPDYYITEAMRALRQSRGILATKASDAALQRIFEQQFEMVSAMEAADPRICAEFLHGGASDGFFEFLRTHRALMGSLARAGLDAMLDGQQQKIERATPGEADFTTLDGALQANGLDRPQIETLLDAKVQDPPLSDTSLCRAGRVYLETLSALPEDIKMRIYALALTLQSRT
ncbi:hypothetical protein PY365_12070 [Roseiarcaceae bacterium H3SJ34-1]|uniref:hypothetical protein n=1 Tax=Terripilifer ovatus TaxID=3032367 RepID=UPI003AB95B37|nr:hypothetical protein [Roseiarcaceae bacterium H3SJ34-1]